MRKVSKILVVEDDEMTQRLIEFVMDNNDFEVTSVSNGKEAMRSARERVFDLVISDINMPHMNGYDFVKKFRKLPEYQLTPFIFLSGNNQTESWVESLEKGADDYLKKPFDPDILIAKVNANLKRSRIQKQQIKISQNNNLDFEKGKIIFCSNKTKSLALPEHDVKTEIKTVKNQRELFALLYNENIWWIIIDQDSEWCRKILNKIQEVSVSKHIPISLLIDKEIDEEQLTFYFDHGASELILKSDSIENIVRQINSRIDREVAIKQKYLNAINIAAQNSPISQEKEFYQQSNKIIISCYHEAFQNLPGGDYYEVFAINENHRLLAIGDVMGKEWGAWFFVAGYLAYLRNTIHFLINNQNHDILEDPAQILGELNKYIYRDLQLSEAFSTLSLILVNLKTGNLKIASAGGIKPFYYNDSSHVSEVVEVEGVLLGLMKETVYKSVDLEIGPGDLLVLFTDGYSEARDSESDEMVGIQSVQTALQTIPKHNDFKASHFDAHFKVKAGITHFGDDRTVAIIGKTRSDKSKNKES
ncbi:response regulator [Fulvivirgaceae bacterium BMA10]|uniref:Response regulator n=1 Tax=Splendidivirga corallicola TaxID=3051826 RepID=A0ABT8KJY6_9BACT|nr:response regulator [Fulvivirgaceae bacterium BMA10]